MNNRNIFRILFLVVLAFMTITSYLWYRYFHNYELGTLVKETAPDIEIINSGKIDYINAKVGDTDDLIPVYYFRIKNNTANEIVYKILINDVSPSEAEDGCSNDTTFKRDELRYELSMKGKVISKGLLSSLVGDLLSVGMVPANSLNDYSLRVFLADTKLNDTDSLKKHYHFVIDVKVV